MSTEPGTHGTEVSGETEVQHDPDYSHLGEIDALRRTLDRLTAQIETTGDPAALVRLANVIARLSDSIVRALAAHHKLAVLSEKAKLAAEWAQLERAREQEHKEEEQRRCERAVAFNNIQRYWLERLSEAAHDAAAGDPASAKDVALGLHAYIEKEDFSYAPDRYLLERFRNEVAEADYWARSASPTG